MQVDDKSLLRLLADDKTRRRAFEIIVSQYSEMLYRQIRRIVLFHDDANDGVRAGHGRHNRMYNLHRVHGHDDAHGGARDHGSRIRRIRRDSRTSRRMVMTIAWMLLYMYVAHILGRWEF